jgi:hypothetical protein
MSAPGKGASQTQLVDEGWTDRSRFEQSGDVGVFGARHAGSPKGAHLLAWRIGSDR